jgi:DNA-binding transcriptional LysR family regulator
MNVELAELRAFSALAAELHFGRAAQKVFMSQPALSRLIQRLEEKAGGRLFTRSRRKVVLTEAGKALQPRARQVLQSAADAMERVRMVSAGTAGALRIGFGVASVCDILPRALLKFRKAYPKIELHMRDMSTPAQISALLRGEIDMGLVRFPLVTAGLQGAPLFHERLVAATPRSFPFKARLGLKSLANAPFLVISRSVSATFHNHVMSVCQTAGITPHVVQEADELFTILNLVRAGLGVALVPRSTTRMNVPGVSYHEIQEPNASWQIGAAWPPNSDNHTIISRFCGVLSEVAAVQDQE